MGIAGKMAMWGVALAVGITVGMAQAQTPAGAEPVNLVLNGGFEKPDANWEWVNREAGTTEYAKETPAEGKLVMRLKPTNSAYPKILCMQQPVSNPPPGKYVCRAKVRLGEDYAGRPPTLSVNIFTIKDGKSTYFKIHQLAPATDAPTGEWLTLEEPVTIPDPCPRFYVQLMAYGSMGHVDFDDVRIEPEGK